MAKKVEFQSKKKIFRVFFALSEQAMEKIEIPRWTKVFFYMLEHFPKSSDHGKFVDVKMFDQIGFPNTLLKGAACVPKGPVNRSKKKHWNLVALAEEFQNQIFFIAKGNYLEFEILSCFSF